jgi:SM-20-related protein
LEKIFATLIDSFIENKIGIAEHFLSDELSTHLTENLLGLYANQQFKSAGIGEQKEVSYDSKFRGDEIYWLDPKNNNTYEKEFFVVMDQFITYLNETCYTGITHYEFHYTLYATGTFYKKHVDQFRNNEDRKFSMVLYLNENWMANDGGELCIHHAHGLQHILPNLGKSVFFKSNELLHEVLVSTKPRMSITGWLKTGPC